MMAPVKSSIMGFKEPFSDIENRLYFPGQDPDCRELANTLNASLVLTSYSISCDFRSLVRIKSMNFTDQYHSAFPKFDLRVDLEDVPRIYCKVPFSIADRNMLNVWVGIYNIYRAKNRSTNGEFYFHFQESDIANIMSKDKSKIAVDFFDIDDLQRIRQRFLDFEQGRDDAYEEVIVPNTLTEYSLEDTTMSAISFDNKFLRKQKDVKWKTYEHSPDKDEWNIY